MGQDLDFWEAFKALHVSHWEPKPLLYLGKPWSHAWLSDRCVLPILSSHSGIRHEIGECLVTNPQQCGQDIPSCHKYLWMFFPFYHKASFPCPVPTRCSRTVKCIENTGQKVKARFRSRKRFVVTIWGPPSVYFFVVCVLGFFPMWFLASVGVWCGGVSECSEHLSRWFLSALGAAQPTPRCRTFPGSEKWIWREKGQHISHGVWCEISHLLLISVFVLWDNGWRWAGLCQKMQFWQLGQKIS